MRFLLGIFTGAALTLLIATTADAPTSPVVKEITTLWQDLITSTGERLFRHRADAASAIPGQSADISGNGAATMVPVIEPELNSVEQPLATAPEPQSVFPGTLLPAVDTQVERSTTTPAAAAESATTRRSAGEPVNPAPPIENPAADALVAEATAQLETLVPESSVSAAILSNQQLAAVWVPFHSERSANGFARSLSRHFAHPFSVQRTGPGAYQVTFAYADPAQREHMLSEIAQLTGQ